jgi:poly(3-hydroxybutyrate) depolymerase
MTLLTGQSLPSVGTRTYHIEVPANPPQASVPAILVFHGGGQDVEVMARNWGVSAAGPPPAPLDNYLLVFPETDPRMNAEWVHFQTGDSAFPTFDLDFVRELITECTTRVYPTGGAIPGVQADPDQIYVAGFSNGGGMVWQLLNSDLSASLRGYAAVGKALDPEKVRQYNGTLPAGTAPAPAPVFYLQGTADQGFRPTFSQQEASLDNTLPFFTLRQMLTRNGIAATAAATTLIPGSTGVTEVVLQLFTGGNEAYLHGTVINGGHNWPTPTTVGNPPVAGHFNATRAIIDFWHNHAGLPM